MRKKLGELLVERQAITRAQLQEALNLQRDNGMRLGTALIHLGHLTEEELTEALSQLFQIPVVDLRGLEPEPEALTSVPVRFAAEHDLFPYRLRTERGRKVLTVAMADPTDVRVVDELGFMSNAHIEPRLAGSAAIDQALRRQFGTRLGHLGTSGQTPMQLRQDSSAGTMTILRPGGSEEEIHTGARPASQRRPKAQTQDIPLARVQEVKPRSPMGREDSAILLTEEVSGSFPVDVQSLPSKPPPLPPRSDHHGAGAPSDAPMGALVGASGQAVDAEAVLRLERRFWALMRVLAKRGLLNKEEFLKELGEEGWG